VFLEAETAPANSVRSGMFIAAMVFIRKIPEDWYVVVSANVDFDHALEHHYMSLLSEFGNGKRNPHL